MDHFSPGNSDSLIDLESGRIAGEEAIDQSFVLGNRQGKSFYTNGVSGLLGVDGPVGIEYGVSSYSHLVEPSELTTENVEVLIDKNSGEDESEEHLAHVEKEHVKEKHKKINYKKAAKPPRPPKGPSLDASDMKLVKEIAAFASKKRARSERMKALRKMKQAKSSSSSNSSISAIVITILFFLVILFQGFCPRGSSIVSFEGSPEPAALTNSLISVQFFGNPSSNDGNGLDSESPSYVQQQASGSQLRSAG